MRQILFILLSFFLVSCSSSNLVAKRYRPNFQSVIDNSNKRVLILEPVATSYKINNPTKENYEMSSYLKNVVKDAVIIALKEKNYKTVNFSNKEIENAEVISLKDEIEKKTILYIQKKHFTEGLISPEKAKELDDNFGESAIKLGRILNTNLIIGIQYISKFEFDNSGNSPLNGWLFQAIDAVSKSGFTKREVYSCFVVLIDALTGNVIYSNGLHDTNSGFIVISEKDLLDPKYIKQVADLIKASLP